MTDYFTETYDVLENKLGIDDPELLKEAEAEIVAVRMAELFASFSPVAFDFECLKHIHYQLFSDIYEFAGEVRTVDIVKSNAAVPFCYAQFIDDNQKQLFEALHKKGCLIGQDKPEFVKGMFGFQAS